MSLHPPTAFAISWLLALVLGCLHLWLWRRDRSQGALASIGIAYVIGAIGAGLVSARGGIPDRLSIDVANALIVLGYGLIWTAMRQFEQRRPRPMAAAFGALVWLLACQIPILYESLPARVVMLSCIVATYCTAAAVELLRGEVSRNLPSRRPLIAVLLINTFIYSLRAPLLLLSPIREQGMALPTSSPWFMAISMTSVLVIVGISSLLVALGKELAEQRSNAALIAARDASERASEEKSRFLARMSHELRTLLNSVLGMAQSLARDPGLTPLQHERATTLERAGRHLVAIVNDILDLARVEAGRLELTPRPVELRGLLTEAIELVRPAALDKRIHLDLVLPASLPAAVLADPVRLRQILLNLLGNGVKFTPGGGIVSLSAAWGPAGLMLVVADNGSGIPEILRDRLFQDYERMGADAAGMEGTGLGLAITAALTRAMGGQIRYEPAPEGSGSHFIVTLPLEMADAPAAVSAMVPPAEPAGSRPLNIMVVDDILANRMVAEALLKQAGHTVQCHPDGPSALAALARGDLPDAVLMDIQMPGMDGFATTAHIRALPTPAKDLRIIAVTAEAAPEEIRACLNAGMDGHVSKPIDRQTLLAAIAKALTVDA